MITAEKTGRETLAPMGSLFATQFISKEKQKVSLGMITRPRQYLFFMGLKQKTLVISYNTCRVDWVKKDNPTC